ncbi:hypothetical protein JTB14_007838, partial [Gonioctena quinquepunctata]
SVRTTTPNYEIFLRTPTLRETDDVFTTPAYVSNKENILTTASPSEMITENPDEYFRHRVFSNASFSSTSADEENVDGVNEETTYKGFLPFLQMVQHKLMKYRKTSRKSKMSVLTHLRDNLLMNIRDRISKLWKPTSSREARGYKDEDHHMQFPSNEGALMTIGFLTFAVFLIKLVIKLVQALKYKFQMYATTTTTTTTAATILVLNRKKRDEDIQNGSKILQYIEEFPHL